jgi:glycosyltransferase involved in cell wall biosynthesis
MCEKLVTVLMPLKYYHPNFLEKAINSVINQSCPDWDLLIIVENGDSKKFSKLLERELKDRRIQTIINEGRKLAGAINTGMKYAKTEFTAILLADDMWSNDAVGVLQDYIIKYSNIDFFHASRVIIDENDNPISPIYQSKERFDIDDFKMGSPVKHLLCWRKDKALAIGGLDESLNSVGPDDYDFPWTMAEKGAEFKSIKECLYFYRDHRESFRLTTHLPLSVHKREIERILKKHGTDPNSILEIISIAEISYLKQCLFRSSFDKLLKEITGYDARKGWRQEYK